MTTDTEREWVTIDEAAAILGYRTREPVLRRIERGEIVPLPRQRGESYRIHRSELRPRPSGTIVYEITTRDGRTLTTREESESLRHAREGAEIRVRYQP